eukprot:2339492-Pyramimonas_sp.AAC.1
MPNCVCGTHAGGLIGGFGGALYGPRNALLGGRSCQIGCARRMRTVSLATKNCTGCGGRI